MTYKLFFSTTLAALTFPFLASAQIKPGPSKVVCVVDADESPADLVREAGWTNPNIQGFLIRQSWAAFEPSQGTYDFHLFDQAMQLAQQNGKFVGLELGAGSFSPKWIYTAGAHPLKLSRAGGQTQLTPVPWDPVFQSAWASVIESLGDRYDNNPAVAYVVMSGVGDGYNSSLATNDAEVSQFDALGGGVFWSHAANDIGDLYAASFPHTAVIMPVGPVVPGDDGPKMIAAVAKQQMESHSGQFGIDAGSLDTQGLAQFPSLLSSTDAVSLAGISADGSQSLPDVMAAAQDSGLLQKASFMEIGSHRVAQDADEDSLKDIGDQLGSSSAPSHESQVVEPSQTVTNPSVENAALDQDSSLPSVAATGLSRWTHEVSSSTKPSKSASSPTYLAAISAATLTAARSGNPIWLSPVASSSVGTGTQTNPIHVSTADQLNAALFPLSGSLTPNLVFHLMAGTFYTAGDPNKWAMSSGWQFLGAGQGKTILKIDPSAMTYTGSHKEGDAKNVISTNGTGNIVVQEMTLDANANGLGSQLKASFSMPSPQATVTVRVTSSAPFTIGKWVYVQDGAPTKGRNLYYALMEVTAIPSSTKVTLKNSEIANPGTVSGTFTEGSPVITVSSTANLDEGQFLTGPGLPGTVMITSMGNGTVTIGANATATETKVNLAYSATCILGKCTNDNPNGNVAPGSVIPATAHVLIAACANGIVAGRNNDLLQNLTIQNVGRPFYEGPAGICLNGFGNNSGAKVMGCTVQNIWGLASWIISVTMANNVTLDGNVINGNGYSQAYSIVGDMSNDVVSNNSATGCLVGFFSDTGVKSNFTVTGNKFLTNQGLSLAGGQFKGSTFSQNYLLIGGLNPVAIFIYGIAMTDCTFMKNTIEMSAGTFSAKGVQLNNNCTGTSGNIFSENIIDSMLTNISGSPDYGTQSGNVDQNGNPVDLGLSQ